MMITTLAAAVAECGTTTWADVVLCAVVVAGVCVFFWLMWR